MASFFEKLILVVQLIWHISRYGKTGRLWGSFVAPLFYSQGYQQDQASLWSLSLIIRLKNPDSRVLLSTTQYVYRLSAMIANTWVRRMFLLLLLCS